MSRDIHWPATRGRGAAPSRRSLPDAARRAAKSWFTRQAILIVAAYFAYFLVRGFTEGGLVQATANAERIIDFERTLGFFWEPSWQAANQRQWTS